MLYPKWTCYLSLALLASLLSSPGLARTSAANGIVQQSLEIPFHLYRENLIIVKGSIGSQENVNILLDTGTNPTAVSTEMAKRLKLQGTPEPLLSATTQTEVQTVILPRIDIGPLHVASVRGFVQDFGFLQRELGISIAAIAGLDVLRTSSLFMIDYRNRKIVFAPSQLPAKFAPFERQTPYLTVIAKIGGDDFRLLVDSGTPGLLLFHSRLKGKQAKLERCATRRNAPMITAVAAMRAESFHASEVQLGTEHLGPQMVIVADADPDAQYGFDGLLGLANTGFQRVWLDFEHGFFGWD